MISFFRSNCCASISVVVSPFIVFFLILLCFSLPAESIPSRSPETTFNKQNTFPDKIFLKVDSGLITLIARDSHLGPILAEIGSRAGVKIKISPALRSKKVAVNLKGVLIEEGLKKIAEDSGLIFRKDEEDNFYLSELPLVTEPVEPFIKTQEKVNLPVALKHNSKAKQADISPVSSASSGAAISLNNDSGNNILLNEVVIRFKQDIPEQDINQFLSAANIKVKKYIAALKYHILSLPEGMTHYDAMVLFKRKKMLYQAEPDYLVPAR